LLIRVKLSAMILVAGIALLRTNLINYITSLINKNGRLLEFFMEGRSI
jgi:hypothetical protein